MRITLIRGLSMDKHKCPNCKKQQGFITSEDRCGGETFSNYKTVRLLCEYCQFSWWKIEEISKQETLTLV